MSYVRPEIAAMAGYTSGEQPRGGRYIKLNTNENPYPASEAVGEAVRRALDDGLGRYPDASASDFREVAARRYGVEPDWLLCGNGSDDILTILTRAFVGQGERLRLPHPSYVLYKTLAEIQGAISQEVHFRPDWSLAPEFGEPSDALRLVCLPNPNSPSGTMIPPEQILALAERLPCPLLVDEAYAEFAQTDCIGLPARCEKILVSRSMSKSYGLAGLRFGYVIAQPSMIEQLTKVKDSYNCDRLSIAGATAALADRGWLERTRGKIIATRDRMTERMRQLGFDVPDSQANFIWCVHPIHPARDLYQGLKDRGILVRYMVYPDWGEGIRISVGTEEQTETCLETLAKLLRGV